MVEERSIGVITVQSFKENAYTDADVNLLRSLASYASIALDNSYAYDKLKEVNEIIKEKNQQITDSLRYARTIEESILPGNNWFEKLFDGHFIIYRPKDIVSGDFYWGHTTAHATFLAAVDCTGHGVPGAFMSMIGNALFNRIVKEARIDDPSEILVKLNAGIKEVLRREDTENSEGMDVCFCKIEQSGAQVKVTFAGAKRPLYYALAGSKELLEVKGDRISIGWPYRKQGVLQEEVKFENSELLLPKGSMLYLSTDGLSDNPGIEGKPKMGTPLIKQTLIQHMETGIAAQGNALNALLDRAQEDREQRDDITFIGVKLK
jgi:serine phosphatase RsbU (regulator of sigma subunit)